MRDLGIVGIPVSWEIEFLLREESALSALENLENVEIAARDS